MSTVRPVRPDPAIYSFLDLIRYNKKFPSSQLPQLDGIPPILALQIDLFHLLCTYGTHTLLCTYVDYEYLKSKDCGLHFFFCITHSLTQCLHVNVHKCFIQYTEEHLYVYILVNTSIILLLPNHSLSNFSTPFFWGCLKENKSHNKIKATTNYYYFTSIFHIIMKLLKLI